MNLINESILESRPEKLEIKSVPGSNAQQLIDEISEIVEEYEDKDFSITHSNGTEYDFYKFTNLNRFGSKLSSGNMSVEDPIKEQVRMETLLENLKKYNSTNEKSI